MGEIFDKLELTGKIVIVIENQETGEKTIIEGRNIVTNDGDKYYAQKSVDEAPDDTFVGLRLGDDDTNPIKADTDVGNFLAGTGQTTFSGYPKTNDDDGDNTGAGLDIATWKYYYTTAQGNASGIVEGAIVDDIVTPTAALTHFEFTASFDKTSNDTLKIFVNHTFNGV